jgi:hypothetical protein
MKELYIFLTHHFEEPFLTTLKNFSHENSIILFDEAHELPQINIKIPIIKTKRIHTSYDMYGHSMYISFFRNNKHLLEKYNYVWVIENDVYVPSHFMKIHRCYDYDLMVPEFGVRSPNWCWLQTLKGFSETKQIGVTGVIMRMSNKFLRELIKIDYHFSGYMEAVLPHICLQNHFTIQCFLPEFIGKVTTDRDDPLLRQIMKYPELREEKLYHPFKKPTAFG